MMRWYGGMVMTVEFGLRHHSTGLNPSSICKASHWLHTDGLILMLYKVINVIDDDFPYNVMGDCFPHNVMDACFPHNMMAHCFPRPAWSQTTQTLWPRWAPTSSPNTQPCRSSTRTSATTSTCSWPPCSSSWPSSLPRSSNVGSPPPVCLHACVCVESAGLSLSRSGFTLTSSFQYFTG